MTRQDFVDKKEHDPMLQVKNWMTPDPLCIQLEQTFREAAEVMEKHRVDGLPIIDQSHQLAGMLTMRTVLQSFLNGNEEDLLKTSMLKRNLVFIRLTDSILDVFRLPHDQLPVIDSDGKFAGILTKRDMLDGFSKYIYQLKQRQHTAEALRIVLESAYEGIAVVDENGVLQEINQAYSRITGKRREDVIGRHVTEVIDNTNLHMTVKTGIPERGAIQTIQGQDMVVHRIPIFKEGRVVGAIGMLIFEGVTEVYKIYERFQEEHLKERKEKIPLTSKPENRRITLDQIIGVSDEISAIKRLARRAARTAATVLITGESGTGKEMFAKSIHHLSPFATGSFISVNCGAIPEHLFEAELFGYEEGAFTGAKKGGKPGKFELAHNGTIFLDEIGEMPLVMQTKLLRVLQEKEAERVGGIKKYPIQARIIAATNRQLKEMVEKGEFREDLYYRLNIIRLHIPPLRERMQDIPILLSYYIKEICEKYQMPMKHFSSEAVTAIMRYPWKGNIREMVNMVERLVTLVESPKIELHHLTDFIKGSPDLIDDGNGSASDHLVVETGDPISSNAIINEAKIYSDKKEKELIIKCLQAAGGNKSKAAEILGIHRTTLYQKLKKHRIV